MTRTLLANPARFRTQQELFFFVPGDPGPSVEERRLAVDPTNPACPLSRFGGDKALLRPFVETAFEALALFNHEIGGCFALSGQPTVCEEVARLFAGTLGLPFVPIRSLLVETANDVLVKIAEVVEQVEIDTVQGPDTLELRPVIEDGRPHSKTFFMVPPSVIYVDELADLPDLALRRVLRATEPHGELDTGPWIAGCWHACWMVRSKDRGLLERLGKRFNLVEL